MEFNMETLMPMITTWGIKIVLALLIYLVGKWIAKRITRVINGLMERAEMDATLVNFLGNIVYALSLIHISEPTRPPSTSRMPSSA